MPAAQKFSVDLLLITFQPLSTFAQQPLNLRAIPSGQRFPVGFQLMLYRLDSSEDMLSVLKQDAGPQIGVASSDPSCPAKAAPGQRLVRFGQRCRQRRGDDMRQVTGHRQCLIMCGGRHLDRPHPDRLPQTFHAIDPRRCRRGQGSHDASPPFEQISIRSLKPLTMRSGDRMRSDETGNLLQGITNGLLHTADIRHQRPGPNIGRCLANTVGNAINRSTKNDQVGPPGGSSDVGRRFVDQSRLSGLFQSSKITADADNRFSKPTTAKRSGQRPANQAHPDDDDSFFQQKKRRLAHTPHCSQPEGQTKSKGTDGRKSE